MMGSKMYSVSGLGKRHIMHPASAMLGWLVQDQEGRACSFGSLLGDQDGFGVQHGRGGADRANVRIHDGVHRGSFRIVGVCGGASALLPPAIQRVSIPHLHHAFLPAIAWPSSAKNLILLSLDNNDITA